MKVLFIGGTGTISTAVSELAVQKGFDLYLLNRGNQNSLAPAGATIIKGDIRKVKEVKKILDKYQFDIVVDWIGFVPEHVENDIEIFKGKIKQYIYISSASAYQKPSKSYLITEETPLENPYWQYSRDKIACEEKLIEEYKKSGFPVTIVRPSHTYGMKMIPFALNSDKYRWTLIDRMLKGKKVIVPGDGSSLWVLTHNTDFAKGFVGLLGNEKSIGEKFHITSDEALSWDQIAYFIGDSIGVKPNIIHITSDLIGYFMPHKHDGLIGDKSVSVVFDNRKIKSFVPDFKAAVTFREGIKGILKWYDQHPEMKIVDEEWNDKVDELIEKYESIMK